MLRNYILLISMTLCCGLLPRCEESEEFRRIVEALEVDQGAEVADVGAGGGTWTRKLANHVGPTGRVFGTDVKESFLQGVRSMARQPEFSQVTPILGSQDDTGLTPGSCEAILLRLVYHAFDKPDAMCKSLYSALQPGGRLLVIDFRPTPDQLARELGSAGFRPGAFFKTWCGQEGVYAQVFIK